VNAHVILVKVFGPQKHGRVFGVELGVLVVLVGRQADLLGEGVAQGFRRGFAILLLADAQSGASLQGQKNALH